MELRARRRLGQYRIVRRLAQGGFADVYHAVDTVEGVDVALKIPFAEQVSQRGLETFRQEARMVAKLDHPSILPIKTAGMIEGRFVVVTLLGLESLEERLRRRLARQKVLDFGRQILEALAHAHRHRIIHCDLKPENLILFPGDRLRLADFGLAKVAMRTLEASGSGTLGYLAPEQALGRPSPRSDVFSAGLLLHRMMSGALPTWPLDRPYPGDERVAKRYHPDFVGLIHKATEIDHRLRFRDARALLVAFRRAANRAQNNVRPRKRRRRRPDWRELRFRQCRREHGRELGLHHSCRKCGGPVSEAMLHCPWCGTGRRKYRDSVKYTARCPRCGRGVKADWKFCPWCYGAAVGPTSTREYHDDAYERRCASRTCPRRELLPFMRYCPWCRSRVQHPWRIPSTRHRCPRCGWGVLKEFWSRCPWCHTSLGHHAPPPRSR